MSAVLDSIQEAIIICDKEGRIIRFNDGQKARTADRKSPSCPINGPNTTICMLLMKTGLFPEEIRLYRALQGERFQDLEIAVIPQHGANTSGLQRAAPSDNQGRISGAVVTMFDITDCKRTEEQSQST
ncbi:MAG: PAS domain-containing protein [Desulfovermiculus sp.]|nr:PAS domain-containing protein [Desulfovermiculus sp.]